MQDKDLQKLRRADLLEMLVELSRENDTLRKQLAAANAEIANREILIRDSGSIAEASMRINGVFEAVQKAADQYLDNVRRMATGEKVPPAPMQLPKESSAARLGNSVLNAASRGALEAPKRASSQRGQISAGNTETARAATQRAAVGRPMKQGMVESQAVSPRNVSRRSVRTSSDQRSTQEKPPVLDAGRKPATPSQPTARATAARQSVQRRSAPVGQRSSQQNGASPVAASASTASAKPASAKTQIIDGSNNHVKHE